MNLHSSLTHAAAVLMSLMVCTSTHAQTAVETAFYYSRTGLKLNNTPLNGTYDLRFLLYDSSTGGNLVAPILTRTGVHITGGKLPTQALDFGSVFANHARWIEVKARQGANNYAVTSSRQRFRPVPLALSLPGLYTIPNNISPNIVGGCKDNVAWGDVVGATISGGGGFGGTGNGVYEDYGTVGGGLANSVQGIQGTIAGGATNSVSAQAATIGGGAGNSAAGNYSAVGGGFSNETHGTYSTTAGGYKNNAIGEYATVPGGSLNAANGDYSFAAGRRAKANSTGAFVWADSTDADFNSNGNNTVTVRASGGVYLYSAGNLSTGVYLLPGSGSWGTVSDRNVKSHIESIDSRDVLKKLAAMPVSTWSYNAQDPSIRHIGPMAQDFKAAFGMGQDDRFIETVDADGVLFAAVQALNSALEEKDAQLAAQKKAMEQQQHTLANVMARLAQLEETIKLSKDQQGANQ